ncbi:MAG: lysophospholipase [Chloroflexi bacterium]|nr:lysophospholipase [Chloroflexota bacterium]
MKTFETSWKSTDGIDLYARGWEPEGAPRAVVCLVHGLGEHVARYENVATALTAEGFVLFGFDQRGHGRSGGPRGHVPSYNQMMDDIALLLKQAASRYPGLPMFLYGHSMGGNEVLNFSLRRKPELKGVIATGPFLRLAFQPPAAQVTLARMMNGIFPTFTQKSGLELAALSRDQKVVDIYAADPLVHDKITARLFVELFDSGEWALNRAGEFTLPLLLMHGSADRLTSANATREFARNGGKNISLHIWDGWYHEIHNEADQAEVFKVMLDWLNERLA